MELEKRVEQTYDHGSLEQTIVGALVAAGKNPDKLNAADLAPVDEFHIGGREATIDLAQRMGVAPRMRVLDIGAGLGGASRYFAGELGCDVTGIDLTEAYVRAAEALAGRVGLGTRGALPARQRLEPAVRRGRVRRRLYDSCRHEHRRQGGRLRRVPPRAGAGRRARESMT